MKAELDIISKVYLQLAKYINKKVPEIRWVDLWADQLFSNEKVAYTMPAVFIEIVSNEIETVGKGVQHIKVDILFHLAYDSYAQSYEGSYNQTDALKFGTIMNKLFKALQNYSELEISAAMNRNAIRREPAPPYVYHYVNGFSTILVDDTAAQFAEKEMVNLKLGLPEKTFHKEETNLHQEHQELKFDLD
jgi:hypothetical protein